MGSDQCRWSFFQPNNIFEVLRCKVRLKKLIWYDDYTFDDSIERKQRFLQEIRRYLPSLQDDSLQADYTGIRPKIYPQGQPAPDFAIQDYTVHGIKNMISLFGIESPGLTSSLAIGNYTCELLGITGKEL